MAELNAVFLFIGGAHQVFHLAPVAARLSADPRVRVDCLYDGEATGEALRRVQADYGADAMRLIPVAPPPGVGLVARLLGSQSARKVPLLLALAPRLRRAAAVVTPERTSAFLRSFGVRRPRFIHFRHGAGDRAPASESRLDTFDLIVVPGEKDVRRAVDVRGIAPAKLRTCGYVKLDYLSAAPPPPRPFADDGPVVVYNPHFDTALSSWPQAAEVVAAFAAQDRYRLIVAPHLRLSQDMGAAARARWQALARPGRIIVDLGSPALIDTSHLRAADIYLGDVSSQLYEFLSRPRPCAFLNAHGVAWQTDPRYAGWHLGEVADRPAGLIAAIDRAVAGHTAIANRQHAEVQAAFGAFAGASQRGADIIAGAIGLAPLREPMLT